MYHPSTIRFVQRIYNTPCSYIFYSKAALSLVKMDQEPFDDAQGFKLATDHESIPSVYIYGS